MRLVITVALFIGLSDYTEIMNGVSGMTCLSIDIAPYISNVDKEVCHKETRKQRYEQQAAIFRRLSVASLELLN